MAASRPRRFSARQALEFILEEGSDIDDSDDNELNEYSSDEYELQDDEMREQDSTSAIIIIHSVCQKVFRKVLLLGLFECC